MTRKEYLELLNVIRTTIIMTDVSKETKREATEVVAKALIKRVSDKSLLDKKRKEE